MTVFTQVCTCEFKRSKDGKFEQGVAFLYIPGCDDALLVVDAEGKPVPDTQVLYHFALAPHKGSFLVNQRFYV